MKVILRNISLLGNLSETDAVTESDDHSDRRESADRTPAFYLEPCIRRWIAKGLTGCVHPAASAGFGVATSTEEICQVQDESSILTAHELVDSESYGFLRDQSGS